jgi:hypothetical protein
MISFLKTLSQILMVLSVLVLSFGVIVIFIAIGHPVVDTTQGFTITGAALMSVLLCGAVWLLADLAEMAHKTQEVMLFSATSLDKIRARQEQT